MNLQKIRKQISKSVDKFLDFAEDKKKEESVILIQLILNLVPIIVVLESIRTMRKMLTLKSLVAKSMFIRIGPNL
jgi:hypothetical protein